jgi:hypothetical protein
VRACGIGNHDTNGKIPFPEMFAFLFIGLAPQIGNTTSLSRPKAVVDVDVGDNDNVGDDGVCYSYGSLEVDESW